MERRVQIVVSTGPALLKLRSEDQPRLILQLTAGIERHRPGKIIVNLLQDVSKGPMMGRSLAQSLLDQQMVILDQQIGLVLIASLLHGPTEIYLEQIDKILQQNQHCLIRVLPGSDEKKLIFALSAHPVSQF